MAGATTPEHQAYEVEQIHRQAFLDEVTGISTSGSGFFAHQPEYCWGSRRWCHVDLLRPVGAEGLSCRVSVQFLGLWKTAQRVELWGVILALQSSGEVHLGVDNLI